MSIRHILVSAYLASAVTFGSGLLRDWALIQQSSFAKPFFELLYFSSLASCFVINAVTLGGGAPTLSFILASTLVTIAASASIGFLFFSGDVVSIAISSGVITMWILGAVASRPLIVAEKMFFGRIRECVASMAMFVLVLMGFGLGVTFCLGVACGTIWAVWASWKYRSRYLSAVSGGVGWAEQIQALLLSNLAGVTVFVWALVINRSPLMIWGIESTTAVRFSVYAYQALSIGAVVAIVRVPKLLSGIKKYSLTISIISITLASLIAAASAEAALVAMPILGAIAHYSSVIFLNRKMGISR